MSEFFVRSRRVITPEGVCAAALAIRDGKFLSIAGMDSVPAGVRCIDAGDSVIMPGIVDTHVHINEPGRTDWEGFETATRAAAAGGVTSVIEMPLNSIPATTTVAALRQKVAASTGRLWIDAGFWGGVVPGNSAESGPMFEAGVWGFKCFLVPSGVDEFPAVTEEDLRLALPELAKVDAPLLVHAELPGPIEEATRAASGLAPYKYSTWLASRPRRAENEAIAMVISLAREFGVRVHIVHLSSSDALPAIREAKRSGVRITVETCSHYLFFSAEDIQDRAVAFKCAPPIRERENRAKLWEALAGGTIDFVATDHSPAPPSMKCVGSGDFMQAWGGISSLQLSLPVLWTEAKRRGYSLEQVCKWLCSGPACFAGLSHKGNLRVGYDADFVVWNPEETFTVEPQTLFHRHKLTPYGSQTLNGVVQSTFLRGECIFDRGIFCSKPEGHVMLRGRA